MILDKVNFSVCLSEKKYSEAGIHKYRSLKRGVCNLNNNPSVIKSKDGELTYRRSTNKSNKVLFPTYLLDSVNNIIRENITSKGFSLNKDITDQLWKITMKPEFKEGIDNGSLS